MTFKDLIQRFKNRGLYVDLDPADTSITLSKKLFAEMGVMKQEQAKVIVFFLANSINGSIYAFELNPPLPKGSETPTAEIMFNTKHHCAGFESLVPTVARILYDYNLPNKPIRLRVMPKELPDGRTAWIMLPPKRKFVTVCRSPHQGAEVKPFSPVLFRM